MQISATALFCIWLTVLSIGYIFVEILWWDNYFFKKSLERNNRYWLDRVIHYILRWIIINFIFIFLGAKLWSVESLFELLNASLTLVSSFMGEGTHILEVQMILFSVWYFMMLSLVLFALKWLIFFADKFPLPKLTKKK